MDILLVMAVGTLNVVCFLIGAKVGQTVTKGKDIEMPNVNPMKLYKDHQEKREADRERDRLETIMRNIERYDGTSVGQEDIPR